MAFEIVPRETLTTDGGREPRNPKQETSDGETTERDRAPSDARDGGQGRQEIHVPVDSRGADAEGAVGRESETSQSARCEGASRAKAKPKITGAGRVFPREHSRFYWMSYYLRAIERRESTHIEHFLNTDASEKEKAAAERRAYKVLQHRMKQVGADQLGKAPFIGPQQERVTVNEILDDMVEHYKSGGKKGIAREVTPQMKAQLRPLREHFGLCRAVRLGTKDVEAFKAKLKHEKRANSTINRSLQWLKQAYRYAASTDPPKLSRALRIELLDESGNRRKGKFTEAETELVVSSLPDYMADVARFGYQTGARSGEILELRWTYLDGDGIAVPGAICKNGEPRNIALTDELQEILERRRRAMVPGCDLIFHNGDGEPIRDYRKCWHSACVANGLGAFYCRDCRDEGGRYVSMLDAKKQCPGCGKKWSKREPKYIGRIFHDFRRSCAYELWKSGNSQEDCMKVTGHKTTAMFRRYADLFTKDEERERQREVQQRRREWRRSQTENVAMSVPVTVQ